MDREEERQQRELWARLQRDEQVRRLRFGPRPEKPRDPRRQLEPLVFGSVALTPPQELAAYLATFRPVFRRADTLLQAQRYRMGLLSDLKRKNGETIEAAVPGATQRGLWDFLVQSPWSAEALDRARVADALQRTGQGEATLDIIVDEVGWGKKGRLSVGVARQYVGALGKVDNAQVIVTLHGVTGDWELPLLGQMYLPQVWLDDSARRERSRIPADHTFATKPQIALSLLDRVVQQWGLRCGTIFADAGYSDRQFIRQLRARQLPFCLGLKSTTAFWLPGEPWSPAVPPPPYSGRGRPPVGVPAKPHLHTVEQIRAAVPDTEWHAIAYRDGTDGKPLSREFVALRAVLGTDDADEAPELVWLLLERPSAGRDDVKQYVLSAPENASLDELAQVAHRRPLIERNSYENAKQEVGLSQYQGRSWIGFHHHLSMVWLGLTFLILHRRPLPPPSPEEPDPPSDRPPLDAQDSAEPDASPSPHPSAPNLSVGAVAVPATLAPLAPTPPPRPRQRWESVQEVHRRLIEWWHGMRFRELFFAGIPLPLPVIGALLPRAAPGHTT